MSAHPSRRLSELATPALGVAFAAGLAACSAESGSAPDESLAASQSELPLCDIAQSALDQVDFWTQLVSVAEGCNPHNYAGPGVLVRQQVSSVTGEPTIGHFELSNVSEDCAQIPGAEPAELLLLGGDFVPEVGRELWLQLQATGETISPSVAFRDDNAQLLAGYFQYSGDALPEARLQELFGLGARISGRDCVSNNEGCFEAAYGLTLELTLSDGTSLELGAYEQAEIALDGAAYTVFTRTLTEWVGYQPGACFDGPAGPLGVGLVILPAK